MEDEVIPTESYDIFESDALKVIAWMRQRCQYFRIADMQKRHFPGTGSPGGKKVPHGMANNPKDDAERRLPVHSNELPMFTKSC